LENFQRMLRVQIADTPFCSETGGIRGFQSRDPSVNRTAVIWGSGFELSASYAVPDASILSMGIHLEMMRSIGEVQDAPVIAASTRVSAMP
jgi:hypothetical protein